MDNEDSNLAEIEFRYSPETERWYHSRIRTCINVLAPVYVIVLNSPSMVWFVPVEGEANLSLKNLAILMFLLVGGINLILGPLLRNMVGVYRIEGDKLCHSFAGCKRSPIIHFPSVERVVVGRGQAEDAKRVIVRDNRGRSLVVYHVVNMAQLLRELECRIPVNLEWTDKVLSPWTRWDKFRFLFIAVLLPLFLFVSRFILGN